MMCRLVLTLSVLFCSMSIDVASGAEPIGGGLIPSYVAESYGLDRKWFTQLKLMPAGRGIVDLRLHISTGTSPADVQIVHQVIADDGTKYLFSDRDVDIFGDPLGEDGAGKAAVAKIDELRSRGIDARVERTVVPNIRLYATTGDGMVHAVDAETGSEIWTTPVGSPRYPTTAPAMTEKILAIVNGQTLYILSTEDGSILQERPVGGAPASAPAFGGGLVFVALLNGHLQAFRIGPDTPWWPLVYRARASVFIQPTSAGNHIVWANDVGDISVVTVGKRGVKFRIRLPDHIAGPILYVPPNQILGVTQGGDLYSIGLEKGHLQWRYACGDATAQPASIVGDKVFLVTRDRGMHTVSPRTGERVWPRVTDSVRQFVAATDKHVYCAAKSGRMMVLDEKTGQTVGEIPINLTDLVFTNNQTDRLYVATRHGALQCLHELGTDLPILHAGVPEAPEEPDESEAPDAAPEGTRDPFARDEAPSGEPDAGAPAEAAGSDPFDPFGSGE